MACHLGHVRKGPIIVFLRWFETMVTSITPCAIILVANISMVYYLRKAMKVDQSPDSSHFSRNVQALKQRRESNVTSMVCVVSLCFFFLAVPLYIHRLVLVRIKFKDDAQKRAIFHLVDNICQKLWYTNNAVNFFIYALVGKDFRRNLSRLVFRKRNRHIGTLEHR